MFSRLIETRISFGCFEKKAKDSRQSHLSLTVIQVFIQNSFQLKRLLVTDDNFSLKSLTNSLNGIFTINFHYRPRQTTY